MERVIEALNNSSIQFNDPLKRALSQTTRVLLELTVFQCIQQKRAVYKETSEKMTHIFKEVKKTIPEEEVVCRFEVNCCKALVLKLDYGSGRFTQTARKHALPITSGFLKGIVSINVSASGGAPLAPIAPVIDPVVDLIKDVSHQIQSPWYNAVFALRWFSIGKRIITLDQFKSFKNSFKTRLIYKNHPKTRYFLCQILFEVVQNENANFQVRKKSPLREKKSASGLFLAILVYGAKIFFGETRYQAARYLAKVGQDPQFRLKCAEILLKRWVSNRETAPVREIAVQGYDELLSFDKLSQEDIREMLIEAKNKGKKNPRTILSLKLKKLKRNLRSLRQKSRI